MPPEERPVVANEDTICVTVIVNGSLGMSPGKIAAKAFQAALTWAGENGAVSEMGPVPELTDALMAWWAQGSRVVVRVAETEAVFERACRELPGVVQRDEGLTEVPDGARCVLVVDPMRRGDMPPILRHKRLQLL